MGAAWRYWQWVKLDPAQGRVVVTLTEARDFFYQQFQSNDDDTIDDKTCQRLLIQQWQDGTDAVGQRLAEVCLRCFISHQIDWICQDLVQKFGHVGGFEQRDLLSLVLDDVAVEALLEPPHPPATYTSLATRILQSFDPSKAQLSTWCRQMVTSHPELSAALKESGIWLESDWSILNNTRPEQLRRILQRHEVSSQGMEQALDLLDSYQAVYRRDRLQQLQTQGTRGRCRPPTGEQLDRILAHLQGKGRTELSADHLLERLQAIAQIIRQSRRPQTIPLEHPNLPPIAHPERDDEVEAENIFLHQYRQIFDATLSEAIAQVVSQRLAYYQRKKTPRHREFLLALRLVHCDGKTMGEIAAQVQLQQQYQVSRLLQLKELRADVRRTLLVMLSDRIRKLAADYVDAARLQQLDAMLDTALEQEVEEMLSAAEKEATTAQSFCSTRFSQALCRHLDSLA